MTQRSARSAVSTADLNRTTLARQMLLSRAECGPVDAVRRLGGLQAQEPASPYIALWTRLASFRAEELDEAFARGDLVKATLMRQTLHAVAIDDYPALWAARALSVWRMHADTLGFESLEMTERKVQRLVEQALVHGSEARTNQEMLAFLAERAPPLEQRDWWWAMRTCAPFVHAPTGGPWSFGRRPGHLAARTLIDMPTLDPGEALDFLVRQYLAAFGPATIGDIAQFTRLPRGRIRGSVARLAHELRQLHDTGGRELADLADGVVTPGSTEAPVRFLPMWDSVLLAYEDRSRIIPADVRRVVIRNNGDILPTFLVDGFVAGVWRAELTGGRTRVVWRAFGKVSKRVRAEIEREAADLARFVEPREPEVFRRFRRWWSDPAIGENQAGAAVEFGTRRSSPR